MLTDRLPLALDRGLFAVPAEGRIGVFGARQADALSSLPKDRVDVIQRHFPDYAAFQRMGYSTTTAPVGPFALSIVCLQRSKDESRNLIAEAGRLTNGPVVIDGAKTNGADRFAKDLRARADIGEVLSKAHGKIFVVSGGDFSDWAAKSRVIEGGYTVPHGAFSAGGVDAGSAALVAALPETLKGRVVDLGAGWGYLAREILAREGVTHLDLVEADHAALDAAKTNIRDARAAFHWADARDWMGEPADHVVTNPPFHTGRKDDTGLGQAFIRQAARLLKPSGTLWLVANRHLPYEKTLEDAFGRVDELNGPRSYKLYAATKPRKSSRISKG